MPIIFWGSRGIKSKLEEGEFYCPACRRQTEYDLRQVRRYFTIYFIPLFPIGAPVRYVECLECDQTFDERVLEYQPPREEGPRQ